MPDHDSNDRPPLRPHHWCAAVLLAAMALITFLNVLGRYLFHYSLAFTEEITVYLFVWLTVIGIGIAFERGGQLGMTTLFKLFPARMKRGIIILGASLAVLLMLAIDALIIHRIKWEWTLLHSTSPSLGIPLWIYYAGVPILSIAVFYGIARDARTKWRSLDGTEEEELNRR